MFWGALVPKQLTWKRPLSVCRPSGLVCFLKQPPESSRMHWYHHDVTCCMKYYNRTNIDTYAACRCSSLVDRNLPDHVRLEGTTCRASQISVSWIYVLMVLVLWRSVTTLSFYTKSMTIKVLNSHKSHPCPCPNPMYYWNFVIVCGL
jgi:hypothetical protein